MTYSIPTGGRLISSDVQGTAVIAATGGGPSYPSDAFVMTVETTTASETVQIPTTGAGYSCTVDWAGESTDNYSGTAPTVSHVFATAGQYQIVITGTFPRVYYNDAAYRLQPISVDQWGDVGITSMSDAFEGCSNLVSVAANGPNVASWARAFSKCSALNAVTGLMDGVSAITDGSNLFKNCAISMIPTGFLDDCTALGNASAMFEGNDFASIPPTLFANCTTITTLRSTFQSCSSLTAIPSGLFDGLTLVGDCSLTFSSCSALVTIPSGLFGDCTLATAFTNCFKNTSSLTAIPSGLLDNQAFTTVASMFQSSGVTSGDFGTWDWTACTNANLFLSGCTINTTDYNASMIGIEAQAVQNGVSFHGGNSVATGSGLTARNDLVSDHSWTITDNS